MGNLKRYYWLKLKEDFFQQKEIKKLRRIAGGDTFTIIYLKMVLKSLKNDGRLYYDGIEDDFVSELALDIDEDDDNVKMTVAYLLRSGILVQNNADEFEILTAKEMTGSECDSAARVRQLRSKNKAIEEKALQSNGKTLHCNTDVTNCNTEIEKELREKSTEKDIEKDICADAQSAKPRPQKHRYGNFSHVLLSDEDLARLQMDFPDLQQRIQKLDDYLENNPSKHYANHNLTIRNWAKRDEEDARIKAQSQPKPINQYPDIYTRLKAEGRI